MQGKAIRSTCGYCSTGCNLLVDPGTMKVIPSPDYPVNRGSACPKGFLFLEPLKAPDRALSPYMKNTRGTLVATDWDTALNAFTKTFKGIQEKHGKSSVAFIGTGQLPTEEIAFFGAPGQIRHGFDPWGRQYPPMCGHCGNSPQESLWL